MWYLIFGGLLVFVGFYLIIKCLLSRKKGIHMDAQLVGFSEERGTQYPLFRFSYEGEELTISGGVPADPAKFKHEVGESVRIIFNPSNRKFVDIEGSATEYLYGIGSIIGGAVLIVIQLMKMGVIG
ncbi:hypothetical protein SAMN02910456_00611 [Ruminococcaceae bacterium YRB3002]|nr:hypothetical protein SAMN02910456_00611 [Ruminococcaceae bacterium YRB3002]